MEDILVPIAFFGMIAALVIVPRYFKSQERIRLQETLRAAIDKGQSLPPEVIQVLTSDVETKRTPPSPDRDFRRGLILLCVAAALVTTGYVVGFEHPHVFSRFVSGAAFPGFLALAYLTMAYLGKRKA